MPSVETRKLWKVCPQDARLQAHLSQALSLHPVIAQLLINRGITRPQEAGAFMSADLNGLHDPFLLKDMDKAVDRIRQARERCEHVLVFGDYDVDGITSSAVLHKALKKMGIPVHNHIPHRLQDGYGLNKGIVDVALAKQVTLLIAVDCGITAHQEVAALNAKGIDVIILDHHEPDEQGLPPALAVVDPKRHDCPYPFGHLASVGLSAKLAQALFGEIPHEDLDLIALGTIADVVQLRGENRILVKAGLPLISRTKNKGLAALMDVARIKGKEFRPHYAGFILGPRLNATGRMDNAKTSLDLLLSHSHEEAYSLARVLEDFNAQRQKLQRDVVQDAVAMIEREVNFKDHKVIVVGKEGWHRGVLGIVASRVTDMYDRPAIVIALEDGVGTASARSIEGFHLHEALTHCSDILENFGGHQRAAGLTIREENISRFRQVINDFAACVLTSRHMVPTLDVDMDIPLSALSVDLVHEIDKLEPYGEGNPAPLFCTRSLIVKSRPRVLGRDTLKFWVSDGTTTVSAVGFGMGKRAGMISPGQRIDLAYRASIDDWNKAPEVQLTLKDLRESDF